MQQTQELFTIELGPPVVSSAGAVSVIPYTERLTRWSAHGIGGLDVTLAGSRRDDDRSLHLARTLDSYLSLLPPELFKEVAKYGRGRYSVYVVSDDNSEWGSCHLLTWVVSPDYVMTEEERAIPHLSKFTELDSEYGNIIIGDTRYLHWFPKGAAPNLDDDFQFASAGHNLPGSPKFSINFWGKAQAAATERLKARAAEWKAKYGFELVIKEPVKWEAVSVRWTSDSDEFGRIVFAELNGTPRELGPLMVEVRSSTSIYDLANAAKSECAAGLYETSFGPGVAVAAKNGVYPTFICKEGTRALWAKMIRSPDATGGSWLTARERAALLPHSFSLEHP